MEKIRIFGCAALLVAAAIVGCGDKKPAASASKSPAAGAAEAKAVELPSIASKLSRYQSVDYGRSLDSAGFWAYHRSFMRSAAAASNFDKSKFAEMAFVEVGSETDAFKRDDKAKQLQPKVDEMAAAPTKFLLLTDSNKEGGLYASVEAYDMESQTYLIRFRLQSLRLAYGWNESPRNHSYGYSVSAPSIRYVSTCMECSNDVEVLFKVPKDRAREVEARLAPLRGAGREAALLRPEFYVSVDKIVSPHWERADVGVTIDAVALRVPGQMNGEPVMFIDGPDLKRK